MEEHEITFTTSEAENAVEALVRKQNGTEKTIADAIDVVLAVNHDAIHRDSMIVQELRKGMDTHVKECHSNDKNVIMGYNMGKWLLVAVVSMLIIVGGNFLVSNYVESHAEASESTEQVTP